MLICRYSANSKNLWKAILQTSHGGGGWFEPSIAHFGKAGLCARIAELRLGPVAQLGERRLRMAEVTSSSLVGSTSKQASVLQVRRRSWTRSQGRLVGLVWGKDASEFSSQRADGRRAWGVGVPRPPILWYSAAAVERRYGGGICSNRIVTKRRPCRAASLFWGTQGTRKAGFGVYGPNNGNG